MAHKVIKESTHIVKKVLTGVVTGVLVTTVLYFLFNKKAKASEGEVRKITIATWKEYVNAENKLQTTYDSSFAKVNRATPAGTEPAARHKAINEFCIRDSNTSNEFIKQLEKFAAIENLDQDFVILLHARVEYEHQMLPSNLRYNRRIHHIMDSSIGQNEMAELLTEAQRLNTERVSNITIRIGRNIDYSAAVLSNKYQYPFAASDLNIYYNYRALRRSKRIERPTGVAPPDPIEKQ